MKFLIIFSLLLLTPFVCSSKIIINEICWMGTENSSSDEWIELRNLSSESIDLTNYTLEAEDGSPIIDLQGTIPANSYFLLERTDDSSVPDITADQIYTGALSNSGEYLKLKENNVVIDEINAVDGWPAGDNTSKQTMQLINTWQTGIATPKADNQATEQTIETKQEQTTTTNNYTPIANAGNNIIGFVGQEIFFTGLGSNDPNGFELSYFWNMGNGKTIEEDEFTYVFNYPGTYLVTLMVYNGRQYAWDTISVEIQTQEIYINEFLPNKWIEIYNNSNSIIDISNWQLDNNANNPFIFPTNTFIAPKSYLIFENEITGIEFNNKDSVKLLLPQEVVFQEINYEYLENELSCSRINNEFIWTSPTPGMANILELIGGKDREITYQYEVKQQQVKQQEQITEYIPVQEFQEPIFSNPLTKQLAMVPSLDKIDKEIENNPINENLKLILIIIIVILSASLIGIFITRFIKT